MHELRHLVSLIQTLLERGWPLPQALGTAWDQVCHSKNSGRGGAGGEQEVHYTQVAKPCTYRPIVITCQSHTWRLCILQQSLTPLIRCCVATLRGRGMRDRSWCQPDACGVSSAAVDAAVRGNFP